MSVRYRLRLSPSLDRFITGNPELFRPSGVFGAPLRVVAQNQNVAEWLKVRLAETEGIAVDRGILLPEVALRGFVADFEGAVPEGKRVLYLDSLKIAVYRELSALLGENDPDFGPLRSYLAADPEGRIYDLSDAAAGLFYNYAMNASAVMSALDDPRSPVRFPEAGEGWQRKLWARMFGSGSPWVLAGQVMDRIVRDKLPWRGGEGRIVLFGSAFLGETALRFFHYLSRFLPVDHCLFSTGRGSPWCGPGRDVEELLGSLEGVEIIPADRSPCAGTGALSELQRRLLSDGTGEPLSPDDTLRVLACPGDLRQTETARDLILGALAADPSLMLTDIGVMAPDINRFGSAIQAVIGDTLPCNFIDLAGPGGTPYSTLPELLFGLAGSRFSRTDLLPLLTNPCFRARHPHEDEVYALWAEALDRLAVTEGFGDRAWSWDAAFGRQAEYFCRGDDDAPLVLFDEKRALELLSLTSLVRSLHEDLVLMEGQSLSLSEWVQRSLRFMEEWGARRPDNREDEADGRLFQRALRNIQSAAAEVFPPGSSELGFPFGFWRRLLLETLRRSRGSRGRYLTGGITCSSLKPLRAVPFRMVLILGLDEELFPVRRAPDTLDLSARYGTRIDFSRETGDLYGFLETVTACGGALTLLYNGSDPRRGTEKFPSVAVTEIVRQFRGLVPLRMPLQPFDPVLFGPDAPVPSFSVPRWREALRFSGQSTERAEAAVSRPLPEAPPGEITLTDLERFLRDPAGHFFEKRFGIKINYRNEEDFLAGTGQEALLGDRKAIPALVEEGCLARGFSSQVLDTRLEKRVREGHVSESYKPLLAEDLSGLIETLGGKLTDTEALEGPFYERLEAEAFPFSGRVGPFYRNGSGEIVITDFYGGSTVNFSRKLGLWLRGLTLRAAGFCDSAAPFRLLLISNLNKRDKKGKNLYTPKVDGFQFVPRDDRYGDAEIVKALAALYRRGQSEPLPLIPDLFAALKGEPGDTRTGDELAREAEQLWTAMLEDDSNRDPFAYNPAVRLYRRWLSGFSGLESELAYFTPLWGGLA